MSVYKCLWIALVASLTRVVESVTVERLQLSLEEVHTLTLNSSIEYMLDFTPNSEQMQFPSRISLKTDGGDTAHPLLVTARQSTGAVSWQLPYVSQGQVLYELESTLCPDDPRNYIPDSECSQVETYRRNAFVLHVSSTCILDVGITILAAPVRDFALPFLTSTELVTRLAAPSVHFYQFLEGQDSVRLVLESEDEVCALISIQNYTCPILQIEDQLQLTGVRFSMLQSGGVQLSRSRFPLGFYVVTMVKATDVDCVGEDGGDSWLQLALAWEAEREEQRPDRVKAISIKLQASLTRGQYAIATGVTATVFVLFYVVFFGAVLAQRWPRFAQYVSPRAPPADLTLTETQLEAATDAPQIHETSQRRARRCSTATFDSSDNSDTDEEYDDLHRRDVTTDTTPTNLSNSTTNVTTAEVTASIQTETEGGNHETILTGSDGAREERNGVRVEGNGVIVEADGTGVEANGTAVVANGTGVEASGTVVEASGTGVEAIGTGVKANGILLEAKGSREGAVAGDEVQSRANREEQAEGGSQPTPFGLPAQLTLAALSRHRARILRVRSDRYLYTLYTVAVFYALPVVQFVSAFQIVFNVSGSLDICYYNFLCSHPAGALSDFNHVFSNLGYMLLGALFLLQLRRRRRRRDAARRSEEYGIPAHYGLLSSLGAGMLVVGVLSASYHVCPNRLNFQFDTAFMYVLAVLTMVKIYQSRHPDVNARAHATFGILAALMALVVWGVLGGGPFFWSVFTVLHLFTFLMLSLRIYYVGQFRLEKETLQRAARQLAALPRRGVRPLYRARLVMLLIANGVNWAFAIWGLWTQASDFAGHLLQLLLLNALLHMVFYLVMKLLHRERPRWYAWCFLAGAAAAWVPALYFFLSGSSDWSSTPAVSRHLNHECKVLQFYDSHDLWHMLSAVALYLSCNAMLTWDDGLAAVKRTDIAVF